MYCRKCGYSMKEDARFCRACGFPVYAVPTVLPDGTRFRRNGGNLGRFSVVAVYMMLLALLIFTGIALMSMNHKSPRAAKRGAVVNTGKMLAETEASLTRIYPNDIIFPEMREAHVGL